MSPSRRTPEDTEQLRASLVEHARRLIEREGPSALTMRALAAEAGCAVGLPYKVFTDRRELAAAVVRAELVTMRKACDELVERAGSGTVAGNLMWFAEVFLRSPAVSLVQELIGDEDFMKSVTASAEDTGLMSPTEFPGVVARYLGAEKRAGRVAPDIDENAFGFLIAGTLHNLLMAGQAWPRPSRSGLEEILAAVAIAIAPGR